MKFFKGLLERIEAISSEPFSTWWDTEHQLLMDPFTSEGLSLKWEDKQLSCQHIPLWEMKGIELPGKKVDTISWVKLSAPLEEGHVKNPEEDWKLLEKPYWGMLDCVKGIITHEIETLEQDFKYQWRVLDHTTIPRDENPLYLRLRRIFEMVIAFMDHIRANEPGIQSGWDDVNHPCGVYSEDSMPKGFAEGYLMAWIIELLGGSTEILITTLTDDTAYTAVNLLGSVNLLFDFGRREIKAHDEWDNSFDNRFDEISIYPTDYRGLYEILESNSNEIHSTRKSRDVYLFLDFIVDAIHIFANGWESDHALRISDPTQGNMALVEFMESNDAYIEISLYHTYSDMIREAYINLPWESYDEQL